MQNIVKRAFAIIIILVLVFITACNLMPSSDAEQTPEVSEEQNQAQVNQNNTEQNGKEEPTSTIPITPTDTLPVDSASEPSSGSSSLPSPATFAESFCNFEIPSGLVNGKDIQCGILEVPENREDPESRTIKIAVAILKNPHGSTEEDPILYLEGGPGGSALEFLYLTYDNNYLPMFATGRDIVLFDQRGVGISQPALDCPQEDELSIELLDNEKDGVKLSKEEMDNLLLVAMKECVQTLAESSDLSQYTSDSNAADVASLIDALGYEQVNLWGVSYGTRLALEVMRDYPEKIRSVLLDSTYPPDANLYLEQPGNFDRVFNVFFNGCESDPECNSAYPDLKETFFETVDLWNENPAEFIVTNLLTGKEYETVIDGYNLMDLIFQFMYDTDLIPELPKLITDVHNQEYDFLSFLIGAYLATDSAISDGMYWSVQCADEVAYTNKDDLVNAGQKYPEFSGLFDEAAANNTWQICDIFNVNPSDQSATEPVSSDIPTLIYAGEYDPITPPSWGLAASRTLNNSTFIEFPGYGHGASLSEGCPNQIAVDFFVDPGKKVDTQCVQKLTGPAFRSDTGNQPVSFIDYRDLSNIFQGKVPEYWDEVNPGVFVKDEGGSDQAILLLVGSANDSTKMFAGFLESLGISSPPEVSDKYRTGEFSWDIFQLNVRGSSLVIALTDHQDQGILIMVQTLGNDRDIIYRDIFIPVLDSITPIE